MALNINVTPKQLHLLKLLHSGGLEWEDLTLDQKLDVYTAQVDITEAVPREKLEEFEMELAKSGHFGATEMVKAQIKDTAARLA